MRRVLTLAIVGISLSILFQTKLVFAGELKITSNVTEAQVFEVEVNSNSEPGDDERKKLLGKTPHSIDEKTAANVRVIKVEKQGYVPVYVPLFGEIKGLQNLRVTLKKVSEWLPEEASKKSLESAEKIVDDIFAIQALLDSKKSQAALGLAESTFAKYPGSVAVSLVYANALLVNGDFNRARSIYAGAIEQIPDTRRQLKESLAGIMGTLGIAGREAKRMPASTSPKPKGDQP